MFLDFVREDGSPLGFWTSVCLHDSTSCDEPWEKFTLLVSGSGAYGTCRSFGDLLNSLGCKSSCVMFNQQRLGFFVIWKTSHTHTKTIKHTKPKH